MIRNYNGNLNRAVVQNLRTLCNLNAKNERNLFEVFHQDGKVSVYENIDSFSGCPDELSTVVTLKSETEVKEYLKKDFFRRIEAYLSFKNLSEDYLISNLATYIKENCKFPSDDEMKRIEKDAEAQRIADLPADVTATPKKITEQDISREILELAEEIIEARRKTRPDDIFVHVEPYDDELFLSNAECSININWDRYEGRGDSTDYSCSVTIKKGEIIDKVFFQYKYGYNSGIRAEAWRTTGTDVSVQTIIAIHKIVVQMAIAEGITFISEIDYEKFQTA